MNAGIQEHATIDTYARKLYLTGEKESSQYEHTDKLGAGEACGTDDVAVSEVRHTAVTNSKNSVLSGRIESVLSMKITQALLDDLTAQAKASPRLRMNYDLRNSSADQSQRMLNAIEPGSPLPIHRHPTKDESFVILRGKVRVTTHGDDGAIIVAPALVVNN